jgi:hypothetical protein
MLAEEPAMSEGHLRDDTSEADMKPWALRTWLLSRYPVFHEKAAEVIWRFMFSP